MNRKVFISFLGTSQYLRCNYVLGNNKISGVRYIQEALLKLNATDWNENDQVLIFTTSEAHSKNWMDNNNVADPSDAEGLETRLNIMKKEGFKPSFKAVAIYDAASENEIWSIFSIVYNNLNDNDHIYFDVTHAFRSIPMFAIVLFNYAKFLKHTSLKAIHYGAFEKLGSMAIVKSMPLEQRDVPVIDLTSFALLQDWTSAADKFMNYGDVDEIKRLAHAHVDPILKETKGKNMDAKSIRTLGKSLADHTQEIKTCRSIPLIEGKNIRIVGDTINRIEDTLIEPFDPLFDIIKQEVTPFLTESKIERLLAAVQWCISKDHIQQGITILNETIVTIISEKVGVALTNNKAREAISKYLNNSKKDESTWDKTLHENIDLIRQIQQIKELDELPPIYEALSNLRNDINHAGMREGYCSPETFSGNLKSHFGKVKSAYESIKNRV